tara:strand:- start:9470 stop:12826 length:3357 start_codon:yes stop_codon:yes gene_type:complete
MSVSYGNEKPVQVMQQGHWIVDRIPSKQEEFATFRILLEGAGTSIVYATFEYLKEKHYLFAKRVGAGSVAIEAMIPSNQLKKFVVGTSDNLNSNYSTRFLNRRDILDLGNGMIVHNNPVSYETDGLGYIPPNNPVNGSKADKVVPGTKWHNGSATIEYWSGDVNEHSWGRHGFSGNHSLKTYKWTLEEGWFGVDIGVKRGDFLWRPREVPEFTGYAAMRMSTYVARYDENGKFLGYVAQRGLATPIAAGTPIATLVQYFSRPQTAIATPGLRHEFYNPWGYAYGAKPKSDDFMLIDTSILNDNNHLVEFDALSIAGWDVNAAFTVDEDAPFNIGLGRGGFVHRDTTRGGVSVNKKDLAVYLEWWDPETGTWSEPSPTPPKIPKCNSMGKTVVVYRFPRQLDPVTDQAEIKSIINAGGPNYSWDHGNVKYYYPYPSMEGKGNKGYALLGRLAPDANNLDAWSPKFEAKIDGEVFGGRAQIEYTPLVGVVDHERMGFSPENPSFLNELENGKEVFEKTSSYYYDTTRLGQSIVVADPSKYHYVNNPQLNTIYFLKGNFKPDSTFIVIGQALGNVLQDSERHIVYIPPKEQIGNIKKGTETIPPKGVKANSHRSHTVNERSIIDGSAAGKMFADFLTPTCVITTNDLLDKVSIPSEEVLLQTWKAVFGEDLTPEWFSTHSIGQPPSLPGLTKSQGKQSKEKPTHYEIDVGGQKMLYPYSIAVYRVPNYWVGPVAEMDEEGNYVQPTPDRPYYQMTDGEGKIIDKMFMGYETVFNQYVKQQVEFVEEYKEQIEMEEAGIEADDILAANNANHAAENVTDEVWAQAVALKKEQMEKMNNKGGGGGSSRSPRERYYVDSWWEANFLNTGKRVPESQLKEAGLLGLGAFSTSGAFTIEDVTDKWGADSEHDPSLFDAIPQLDMNMDLAMDDQPTYDPLVNLGAIEALDGFAEDAGEVLATTVETGVNVFKTAINAGDTVSEMSAEQQQRNEEAAELVAEYEGAVGLAGWSNLGSELPESVQAKVQEINENAAIYAAYGRGAAAFGREVTTGLMPDTLKEWYAENQPYSTIGAGLLALSAIPFVGSGTVKNIAKAPFALGAGLLEGAYVLTGSLAKSLGLDATAPE